MQVLEHGNEVLEVDLPVVDVRGSVEGSVQRLFGYEKIVNQVVGGGDVLYLIGRHVAWEKEENIG